MFGGAVAHGLFVAFAEDTDSVVWARDGDGGGDGLGAVGDADVNWELWKCSHVVM